METGEKIMTAKATLGQEQLCSGMERNHRVPEGVFREIK